MNKYTYKVELVVEVEAFDESDAWEALQDDFGVGEQMGMTIVECEYKEVRARRK